MILSSMIGQSPRRKEDERLIAGRGRFIDDIVLPGSLHLALVRSTHARARVIAIDATGARMLPGVAVFLAADLPELAEPLPAARADPTNPYVRLDTPRPQRPLALGETRYVGEPIAAVVKRATSASRSPRSLRPTRIRRPMQPRWFESSTIRYPPWSTPRPR